MLEMTDRDIYVHWKTAKSRKYEIDVLAQLNGTTPKAIQEIIDRMAEQEGVEVTDREDKPVDKLEKQAERQRKQSREYQRRVRAEERAEAEAVTAEETKETKEEQKKMTMEEKKAKKAAYMKKYLERKKVEKAAAKTQQEETEQKPEEPKMQPDDSELIRKALQNFSIGLEEAIEDQKAVLAATKKKLAAMEEDLKRCRELLGYEPEVEEGEG